jgi:hypothetical protein
MYAACAPAEPPQPIDGYQPAGPGQAVVYGGQQSVPVQASAPSADDAYPALPYSEFLANGEDEGKRQAAWVLYHAAEREARTFAPGRWIPIAGVVYSTPDRGAADWSFNTRLIHMQDKYDGTTLFHELFHPAFHNSPFNTPPRQRDSSWAEAFCNAFRYYAEKEFVPGETPWAAKFDRIANMTEQEGLGNGNRRMRVYVYPAALVIKRAGGRNGSMDTFRKMWFDLIALHQQRGGSVLDEVFGYSPP